MKRTGLWPHVILIALRCALQLLGVAAQEATGYGENAAAQQTTTAPILAKIDIQDGRLSMEAKEVPLGWLLQKLSDQSRISIVAPDVGAEKVSLVLSNASLEEVLRQLLHKYDYFIYYSGDMPSPSAVWVYGKGQGRGIEPVPAEQWASTKEFERQLTDKDPDVRANAIEVVIERKGGGAKDEIIAALDDENERVRTQALYYSQAHAVELPAAVLGRLATNDPSANVRYLALEALASSDEGKNVARAALNDSDPNVQAAAREILGQPESVSSQPSAGK